MQGFTRDFEDETPIVADILTQYHHSSPANSPESATMSKIPKKGE